MGSKKYVRFGKAGTASVEICEMETGEEVIRLRADAVREVCRQIFHRGGFSSAEEQEDKTPESGV